MNKAYCAVLAASVLIAVPAIQAQNCSNSQFKGVYSALAAGEVIDGLPAPLIGPTTRIGRAEVDGKGTTTIHATTSLNGIVLSEEYGGTYSINPDCTATVNLLIPFPIIGLIPFTFQGVLSNNFQEMDLILVNPPASTIGLTLRQQNRSNCSARDLNGGYTVSMRGFNGPLPFHRLGRIVFDGRGGFSAATTVSNGGAIAADAFSGTYAVESSCEFTLSYSGNTWKGILFDNSRGASLIVTGPTVPVGDFDYLGAVIGGTLKKQ